MIHSLPLDIRCVWDSASGLLFMISILLTKRVEVNSFSEKSGKTDGKKENRRAETKWNTACLAKTDRKHDNFAFRGEFCTCP